MARDAARGDGDVRRDAAAATQRRPLASAAALGDRVGIGLSRLPADPAAGVAPVEHWFTAKPPGFRGKVHGGMAVGCTCGSMTVVRTPKDGAAWFGGHKRSLPDPRLAELERLTAELADVQAQLAALAVA